MAGETLDAERSATAVQIGDTWIDPLDPRLLGACAFGAAALAYVIALISQYGFGWEPCPLCLWQRVPYIAGLALAAPAVFWRASPRLLYAGAALAFTIGFGLASYHTLVEFGVLEGLSSCSADTGAAGAAGFDAFMKQTENEVITDCGVRTPYLLGLTMTNLNALVSADIATIFALAAWRAQR